MTPPAPGDLVLCVDGLGRCRPGFVVGILGDAALVCEKITRSPEQSVLLVHEGITWVRGHEGEVPDGFRAQVALLGNQAPAVWAMRDGVWLCVQSGAGGTVGDWRVPTSGHTPPRTLLCAPCCGSGGR